MSNTTDKIHVATLLQWTPSHDHDPPFATWVNGDPEKRRRILEEAVTLLAAADVYYIADFTSSYTVERLMSLKVSFGVATLFYEAFVAPLGAQVRVR